MAKLDYNELKIGKVFLKDTDPDPYQVTEYAFVRMQQGKPVTQLKIKNLITGKTQSYTAHQNGNFTEAEIDSVNVIFIYHNNGQYWFHELGKPQNRFFITDEVIDESGKFLKPNTEVKAFKFNDKIINIQLPIKMDFKVIEAPPSIKGNTSQGGTKLVTLETGAKISVPIFINEGDVVRVNTQTGEYSERAEKN